MNIFLICPVRNADKTQKQKMDEYISRVESTGDTVYYPARDTDQNDSVGYRICVDNKKAIKESDEVHIFWDKTSQGSLFDLGMTFALNKKIKIVNLSDVQATPSKSFSNMIREWSKNV